MRRAYPAVIDKDPDSIFGISFPDFPGCISGGDSIEAAIASGTEALNSHIALMAEDNDPIPVATQIQSVLQDPEFAGTIVCVVLILAVMPSRPKQITVTLDESLLEEIDAISKDRSGFLAGAARVELARRHTVA